MIMKLNDTSVRITNFYENLSGHATMNATNSFEVAAGVEFSDISELEEMEFQTCVITNDDGIRIPTQGLYKKVDSINVTYDERSKIYTANMILISMEDES